MRHENSEQMKQALTLASLIRNDHQWIPRLIRQYWGFAFKATRVYERYFPQRSKNTKNEILNFGCGNRFYENAINSDLLAPHRYLKNKRRPDLYWSGTINLKHMQNYFNGIVCEHVIEHILPDEALGLFSNFLNTLKPGGTIVVSFPDIRRVLNSKACQGFTSPTVAANSVIYRFEHRFMYDTDIVCEMLMSAGFENVSVAIFSEVSLNQFLDPNREAETSYVIAKKSLNIMKDINNIPENPTVVNSS
jgi:predicted SAM-dependent methyltransferase